MSDRSLITLHDNISDLISRRRLAQAIDQVEATLSVYNAPWQLRERIEKLRTDYGYLRRYALDGVADPGRASLYDAIASQLLGMTDEVIRASRTADSPRLYFSTLRYENMQPDSSITSLLECYTENVRKTGLALFGAMDNAADDRSMRDVQEKLASRLFALLWVTHPLSDADAAAIEGFICDPTVGRGIKQQLISSLMLGALEIFDAARLRIMLSIYYRSGEISAELRLIALASLLIAMWGNRGRLSDRRLADMLAAASELPSWTSDLRMVFVRLLKATDTERITGKMEREVIPGMMKIKPELDRKIKELKDLSDLEGAMEENPEWEEVFERSGLAEKLRELNELQSDGGDVMMVTFSRLKNFPFFSDPANWFLVFDKDHSSISFFDAPEADALKELVAEMPYLCDSDKYSMMLSMNSIPEQQRVMMMQQFRAGNINFAEITASSLRPEAERAESEVNRYIQNLYRFFNLFRRKNEFTNPFAGFINLPEIDELSEWFDDAVFIRETAEFYFKRGYYAEALAMFGRLTDRGGSDQWQVYQKTAYCMQKLGRIEEALAMYGRSELTNPDNVWTLRRMAQCSRMLGRNGTAIEYYRRISALQSDDLLTTLNIGMCLMDLHRYEEAMKEFFKVEYLDEHSDRAWRPIVWCAFRMGDMARARAYSDKILASSPKAEDYLNAGHIELSAEHPREAASLYLKASEQPGKGSQWFLKAMEDDAVALKEAGVDDIIKAIVIEEII